MNEAVPERTIDVHNCRCGNDHIGLPLGQLLNPREVTVGSRTILAHYLAHCPVSGYAIYAERPKGGGETVQDRTKQTKPGTNESGTETEKPKTTEVEDETGKDEQTTDDDKPSE